MSSPVGSYPIIASGGSDHNYEIELVHGTLEVTKTPLLATPQNKTRQYGTESRIVNCIQRIQEWRERSNKWNHTTIDQHHSGDGVSGGQYPIRLSGGNGGTNYSLILATAQGSLYINKAEQIVTFTGPAGQTVNAAPITLSGSTKMISMRDRSLSE